MVFVVKYTCVNVRTFFCNLGVYFYCNSRIYILGELGGLNFKCEYLEGFEYIFILYDILYYILYEYLVIVVKYLVFIIFV